jgi:hypothetical protein
VVSTKTPIRSSERIFFGPAFAEVVRPVTPAPIIAVDLRKSRRLLPDIFPSFHKIFNMIKKILNSVIFRYKIIPYLNKTDKKVNVRKYLIY